MKTTAIFFLAFTVFCYALPFSGVQRITRDVDLVEETDRLLFATSMADFQTARNAQNPAGLDWYSNGCTASPDQPLGYDFTPSCQRHDFGYHNFKIQARFTEANKDRIDGNFKTDLYNECNKHGKLSAIVCKGTADVYHEAVRAFGG